MFPVKTSERERQVGFRQLAGLNLFTLSITLIVVVVVVLALMVLAPMACGNTTYMNNIVTTL